MRRCITASTTSRNYPGRQARPMHWRRPTRPPSLVPARRSARAAGLSSGGSTSWRPISSSEGSMGPRRVRSASCSMASAPRRHGLGLRDRLEQPGLPVPPTGPPRRRRAADGGRAPDSTLLGRGRPGPARSNLRAASQRRAGAEPVLRRGIPLSPGSRLLSLPARSTPTGGGGGAAGLGDVYRHTGRYSEAMPLFEEALGITHGRPRRTRQTKPPASGT